MTKISQLSQDTTPTLDDYTVTVDLATGASKRVTLSALMALFFANFDWSLNMKKGNNTTALSIIAGNNDFSSVGLETTFTVASACNALVNLDVSMSSNSDFEFKPQIYLDGTLYAANDIAAAIDTTSTRGVGRSFTLTVPLTAGTHTISGGMYVASGGAYAGDINVCHITALVLGKVTA